MAPPTTEEQEESLAPSPPEKRKSSIPSKGWKRGRATDLEDENNAEAAAASASPPPEHAASSGSSAVSSPLRWPELPRAIVGETAFGEQILEPFHQIDPAVVRAHGKLVNRYAAKKARQLKLVSLDQHIPRSCMSDSELLPVRESVEKSILQVAKSVLGLSSYIEGKLLRRTSGFLIDWDAENKVGTVLTSALLIQSKSPSLDQWLAADEYSPDAEVHVHLMDKTNTTVVAELLHYDKHYNLALFKISKDFKAHIPSFTSDLSFAEDVFVLGRDKDRNLTIDHGKVEYKGPSHLQRHHYMFITCGINKMWKTFDCIPRLHLGMKFSAISFLDLPHREKIACKCDVNDGLIVKQVSEGSVAEKVGVRRGDIIKSWNDENISTTIEVNAVLFIMFPQIYYISCFLVPSVYPVTAKDCAVVNGDTDDGLIYGKAPTDDEDDEV
ncbi:hypothetical protein HU200_020412 [Digitaria exilis]|uniref:PDZ domain-containing protein n=1 Tax=Digitaria exilis TaxID=1010633 RepID=A0A835F1W1_9POAL|nr:hypothetical protein HU200_020412 [Digitaria exilis]